MPRQIKFVNAPVNRKSLQRISKFKFTPYRVFLQKDKNPLKCFSLMWLEWFKWFNASTDSAKIMEFAPTAILSTAVLFSCPSMPHIWKLTLLLPLTLKAAWTHHLVFSPFECWPLLAFGTELATSAENIRLWKLDLLVLTCSTSKTALTKFHTCPKCIVMITIPF